MSDFIAPVLSSQGSRFYENEVKREQQVNQRIEKMMQRKAKVTEQELKKAEVKVRYMSWSSAYQVLCND